MLLRHSFRAALLGLPLLAGCSATERTTEAAAPRAVPNEVVTDADRRAIYNANGPRGAGCPRRRARRYPQRDAPGRASLRYQSPQAPRHAQYQQREHYDQ
ncbi:MAG: hypothetical protein WKG07_10330 [Hymenobacter sp.]